MNQPKTFKEVMNDPNEGWPTVDDFINKRVYLNVENVNEIIRLLDKRRLCLIIGGEGRGKTVHARIVGYIKNDEKWRIRFIDIRTVRSENIDRICFGISKSQGKNLLYIVENSHASLDELAPRLIRVALNHKSASFIFTSRELYEDEILVFPDPFEKFRNEKWIINLKPSLDEAICVVNTFLSSRNIDYPISDEDKSWIIKEFGERAINLRRLNWFLQTLKHHGGKLHSLSREAVYRDIFKFYFSEIRDDNLEELLITISAIYQFDINFYGKNYNKSELKKLVKMGILAPLGRDYYKLQHSSDSTCIVESVSSIREKRDAQDFTLERLKNYLISLPENYFELIKALFYSREKYILLKIFEDSTVYSVVFRSVVKSRIKIVLLMFRFIYWACGPGKAKEFWIQFKNTGGKSQKEKIKNLQSKLSNAHLLEIVFLITNLKKISNEEKQWFIKKVLRVSDIIKMANEAALSTINSLFLLLPDNKVTIIISRLDPEIMADKIKNSSAQKILWFMHYLKKYGSQLKNEKIFKRIDAENLAYKLNKSALTITKYIINRLPDNKASIIISRLDPKLMANNAKSSSAQQIMWFVKECKTSLQFICAFFSHLNRTGVLIDKLEKTDMSVRSYILKTIRRTNRDLYQKIENNFPHLGLLNWLDSGLSPISRKLHRFKNSIDERRKTAVEFVNLLSCMDISERISELFTKHGTKPLKTLSRLLHNIYCISYELDKDAVKKITKQIVDNINSELCEGYSFGQLSFLLYRVKQCSESEFSKLCNKILSEMNIQENIGYPFNEDVTYLILQIFRYDKKAGMELAYEVFQLDFSELFKSMEIGSIANILWNLNQVDNPNLKKWIAKIKNDDWLSKIEHSAFGDSFRILWNVYNINKRKAINLANRYKSKILADLMELKPEDLSLFGFLKFCDIDFKRKILIPRPKDIALHINKTLNISELAFCLYFLKIKNENVIREFSKEIAREICISKKEFSLKDQISYYPFVNTKQIILKIFNNFILPQEPESTLKNMLSITRAYLNEKNKNKITYKELLKVLISQPYKEAIFKNEIDASKWIIFAVENGIYEYQRRPSFKNQSREISLYSIKE